MQDEINEKVVALSVKGAKLTAEMLQKAIKAMLAQAKKQQEKQPHGKQTLKQLAKQNAGLSNIEITEGNIKAFEQTAKKYGIDFALKKDSTETPPRYLVFFKGRDADALTAAFKEFSAKKLTQEQKPPIRKLIVSLKEKAAALNTQRDKVKNKDRGIATASADTVSYWTTGRNVSARSSFPVRFYASGFKLPYFLLISYCMQSFSRQRTKSVVPSAARSLYQNRTASNTARTAGSGLPADRQPSA